MLQHRCFPANIEKFLRTAIMKNICERLHLPVSIGTKPTTFTLAAMSEPLFAQNYFGLTLELYIAFIAEDFAWFHFERF